MCIDAVCPKLSKSVCACQNYSLLKLARFIRHSVYVSRPYEYYYIFWHSDVNFGLKYTGMIPVIPRIYFDIIRVPRWIYIGMIPVPLPIYSHRFTLIALAVFL